MASVIQKLKGRRNLSREFQITFSVNTLILECLKDDWQPEKLVIVWNKDDKNCHTKPIPWQPECDNPVRGVHVWPEPDPVTLKTTLYKHHQIEGIYLDRCLKIQIKNETNRGQRKVIATGSLALDHYVTEEEHSFEVVVKLFPSNKNVLSGSIKFQLTSVMLVNGVPYCFNVKEEMRKYVKGAVKSSSSVKKGTKGREDGLKCGSPGSSKMDSNAEQSRPQRNSLQTAEAIGPNATKNLDCASRNNEGPKKPRRKPPLPPLPPRNQPPVAPVQDSNCDSIEMKDLTVQSCKDQHAKDNDNCPPCSSISSKGKMKPKTKYPEELNPFAGSMYEEGQDLANFDETSLTEKAGLDDKQNPLPKKHKRKTRRGGKKNKKKYHKGWNPLGGGSFEELLSLHSEESADENTCSEDAPQTVKKTKPSLPNNKLKNKTDYPKSLKQFCASSDKEEDETSSKSDKVLPSKTMYLENASGVTKENSKVQRDSWSEFSSPEPQGKKEHELNVEKASQPESMEISESEETWKVEDNIRDETVELKEANNKALAHNSFQTKFEEACHSVGVGEVGATDEGASAVDERPVRSEGFSREGQEVMTEPEEEEEEEEEEALKDDSGKMTAWICEEGESVVSAGKGLSGVYPESQDIAGEQHPVGNESVQRTGEGAMHYNAVGTKAVAGTTSLKDVNKPCEAEDKVDTHCQKSKFAGPFHDDVVLSDGDKPKPCEAEDKVDTDYQESEVASPFHDDVELSDGDNPFEADSKVDTDCQRSEVAVRFHDDLELSDGDKPCEADNEIDTDCQGSEVAGRFHDDIELSDGDNPFEANDKVDSDCQMPEDAGYFLDDMEEKVEADVQKREDSTTVDGDLLGDDGKPIPLALYANGFQGVEEFPECCQANAENDYVACPDPLELLGSRNDLSPDFVDNSSLVISQVADQSEPDIECDLASADKPKQKCHSIYHRVMSPLQKKVASLKGKLPQKPPRLSLLRKKAAFASSELLKSRLEISAYVAEEMFTLDQEIDSLSNVIFKVENELQEAMKFAELHEESSGLKQDWLSLNNVLDQLKTRKQNLEILEICESLQECVDILRGELKLLFEMEDWRKSDRQRAQEASILSLVLLLENRKRVNY